MDLNFISVNLLQTTDLCTEGHFIFFSHAVPHVEIRMSVATKTDHIETLIDGGQYDLFRGIVTVAESGMGMVVGKHLHRLLL